MCQLPPELMKYWNMKNMNVSTSKECFRIVEIWACVPQTSQTYINFSPIKCLQYFIDMIQIWILINMCPTDPSYSLIPEYFIMLKAQQGQIWIPNKFWALGNIYPFHLNIIKITIDQPIYIYLLTHKQDLIIIFNHYSTFPLDDGNNLSIS